MPLEPISWIPPAVIDSQTVIYGAHMRQVREAIDYIIRNAQYKNDPVANATYATRAGYAVNSGHSNTSDYAINAGHSRLADALVSGGGGGGGGGGASLVKMLWQKARVQINRSNDLGNIYDTDITIGFKPDSVVVWGGIVNIDENGWDREVQNITLYGIIDNSGSRVSGGNMSGATKPSGYGITDETWYNFYHFGYGDPYSDVVTDNGFSLKLAGTGSGFNRSVFHRPNKLIPGTNYSMVVGIPKIWNTLGQYPNPAYLTFDYVAIKNG